MIVPKGSTFCLVNDSVTDADTNDASLANAAAAIDHALQHAWGDIYGGNLHCRAATAAAPIAAGEIKVSLQEDSNVAGAGGYHTDDAVYCFRDGLPSFSDGDFAFTVVISHEIFETALDPGANRWAFDGNATMYALEACDAVEGFSFKPEIDAGQPGAGISLSDFLLPSFFDPSGVTPFSHCNVPTAPFTTAPDSGSDYQIALPVGMSGESQVTAAGTTTPAAGTAIPASHPSAMIVGAISSARAKAKAHKSSRTSRRLLGTVVAA